jgi:hypothetical protein
LSDESPEFAEWTAGDLRRFLDGIPEQTIVRVLSHREEPVEEAVSGLTLSDDLYLAHESQPEDDAVLYIVVDGRRDSQRTVDLRRAWDARWYLEGP